MIKLAEANRAIVAAQKYARESVRERGAN